MPWVLHFKSRATLIFFFFLKGPYGNTIFLNLSQQNDSFPDTSQPCVINVLTYTAVRTSKSPYCLQQNLLTPMYFAVSPCVHFPMMAFALQVSNVNGNVHHARTHTRTHYCMRCLVCGAIDRCVPALGIESVVQLTLLNVRWQQMYCTGLSYLLDCDVRQVFTFANVNTELSINIHNIHKNMIAWAIVKLHCTAPTKKKKK